MKTPLHVLLFDQLSTDRPKGFPKGLVRGLVRTGTTFPKECRSSNPCTRERERERERMGERMSERVSERMINDVK